MPYHRLLPNEMQAPALKSNEASLKKAVAAIAERLKNAKSVVALPAFTVARLGLRKELRQAIEGLGCPFATTSMEKVHHRRKPSAICRSCMRARRLRKKPRQIVEGAEVVLDLGGVNLNDDHDRGLLCAA